jgi:hypothetical protein
MNALIMDKSEALSNCRESEKLDAINKSSLVKISFWSISNIESKTIHSIQYIAKPITMASR